MKIVTQQSIKIPTLRRESKKLPSLTFFFSCFIYSITLYSERGKKHGCFNCLTQQGRCLSFKRYERFIPLNVLRGRKLLSPFG